MFSLIQFLLKKPKLLFSSLKNIKSIFLDSRYSYFKNLNNILAILCYKNSMIPKLIANWEFNFYSVVGPFLCLKRNEIELISFQKSNTNYKYVKCLYKFAKNKYLMEDMYFSTLYLNLINSNKNDSISIISYYDINSQNDWNYFIKNIYSKNVFFVRRVLGNNVNLINKNV